MTTNWFNTLLMACRTSTCVGMLTYNGSTPRKICWRGSRMYHWTPNRKKIVADGKRKGTVRKHPEEERWCRHDVIVHVVIIAVRRVIVPVRVLDQQREKKVRALDVEACSTKFGIARRTRSSRRSRRSRRKHRPWEARPTLLNQQQKPPLSWYRYHTQ